MAVDPRQLSVLAVSPIADVGGAEVLVVDVLRGLHRRGGRVGLVTMGCGPLTALARTAGLHILPGPRLSFRDPASVMRSARHLRHAVRRFLPDIVHATHPRAGLFSRLALMGRSARHTTQLLEPPAPRDLVGRACLRLGGTYFALTPAMAAAHREVNPRLDPVVVEPGVDAGELVSRAEDGDGDRCWSGLSPAGCTGPRIVMVARLQPFKGVFDFVRMASAVSARRPDARFMIIGPDSSRSPGVRAAIRAEIQARGLEGKASLSGPLSASDLAATVQKATLLVHPAHREGFGLVVVEALALGTPVVAYAASGPALILKRGGGRLAPVRDVDALAEGVLDLIAEPAPLHACRQEAVAAARRFRIEETVSGYLSAWVGGATGCAG